MLSTDRLILREWRQDDLAPFARLNADTEVMRYFPATLSGAETEAAIGRLSEHIASNGFGFWAAELKDTREFIGFVGMQHVPQILPCAPAVEIGWRLDKNYWGRGLAPEAARACLLFAFSHLGLDEVVSFTAALNEPSQRVMQKIGMIRDMSADFEHPAVSSRSQLRRHVLYRIDANDPIGF